MVAFRRDRFAIFGRVYEAVIITSHLVNYLFVFHGHLLRVSCEQINLQTVHRSIFKRILETLLHAFKCTSDIWIRVTVCMIQTGYFVHKILRLSWLRNKKRARILSLSSDEKHEYFLRSYLWKTWNTWKKFKSSKDVIVAYVFITKYLLVIYFQKC